MTFCGKYILIYCKDATPSRINNCWATPRHGQDTVANRSRWDGRHPLLLQCLGQLTHMSMQEQWIEAPLVLHVQDALNVHDTLLKPCIHSSSSFWLPPVLCFNTTTPDVMQPATLRSFLPVTATMSKLVPGFLSCPIQQVWNELDRRVWGRSERTCTSVWAAVPSTSGVDDRPKASHSQPHSVHAHKMPASH